MWKKTMLLGALFVLLFANNAFAYDVQLKPFQDEEQDYAKDPIYTLSALGIINGYEDQTYRPNNDLSREAFIKLLVMAGKIENKATGGRTPADVSKDRWSAPYIAAVHERKWLDNLIDQAGLFHPEQTITREEVAMLVGKSLLDSESEKTRQQWLTSDWLNERIVRGFKDDSAMNEAMKPYVYYAAHRGIMEGDQSGFNPKESLIRKQAAAVIYRLIDKRIAEQKIDVTGYYAIQSYAAIEQMNKLSHVILGWSNLSYSTAGTASLNINSTVNRVPSGYEEVLAAANAAQIPKELMVFYDGANLKDFLKDQAARAAFMSSLLHTLKDPAYSFTGVSIDFEGLKDAASAADYTHFLQELKSQLGSLTLSVAVPPTYYYKGYDLKEIGKLADMVILMAYDFTHDDNMLPSAPLPLVNDTVMAALQSIPKEKLVLGISKQANQWITTSGVTGSALNPAIADVEKRLAMPGVDAAWAMPYFLKKATFADERGSHVLYYEDSQSIAKKIWLAKFYDLQGVSLWYMGNYTKSDWEQVGELAAK
ncbi:glycosyl hydrolase family 18 protein [Paenibacillus qinlingensis]|uniref:Spore germination protein YaaH n=1 Tax=Paenibacillus qinlingensis TaxID=1837343 RepID=A0ABU1P4M6_9BACL|nr:glycosyl hydrolase family 18 protein [Paenibacillus qinlingensis]MDR6554694.1 spore germination protein YaaH [Paenibacillus qinlingensis]